MSHDPTARPRHDCCDANRRSAILPRWGWFLLLALSLIGLCSTGWAGDTGSQPLPEHIPAGMVSPLSPADYPSGPTVIISEAAAATASARPERVELLAELANYDRDARPDGWKVTVLLLDADDQLVRMRSQATFELRPGRVASDGMNFIAGNRITERWSMPLDVADDGVARVRLTPRHIALPWMPSHSSASPAAYARARRLATTRYPHRHHDRAHPTSPFHSTFPDVDRSLDFLASDRSSDFSGAEYPVYPRWGLLSVRVSVPTQGTFDAVSVVPLSWPIANIR